MKWFKSLAKAWDNWVGDRDLERKIRAKLTSKGYVGDSAQFQFFRLAAIQRPGWLQVFHFCIEVKPMRRSESDSEQWLTFHGVVRQDERYKRTDISLSSSPVECAAVLREWSRDLISLRRR
jgi:hypothetical protein